MNFEEKVEKPLNIRGSRCANIDVSYSLGNTTYYVESKFLEPYYSKCKHNTDSYCKKDNYKFPEAETSLWLKLLDNEKDFHYYDFSQLYRHLLAIRRKQHDKQDNVVLQSISWKMTDSIAKEYVLSSEDKKWLIKLDKERRVANKLFNDFLKDIGWENCHFETKSYNDMLNDIKGAPQYDDFCKQYFFD